MINTQINELVAYGLKCGLVSEDDQIFVTNQLLDLFRLSEFHEEEILKSRPLAEILEDMVSYAHQKGILEEDTIAWKDLFDTRIMGLLTPLPSVVRSRFQSLYQEDRKKATDYFYKLSQDTNYIRTDRIAKDEKWHLSSTLPMPPAHNSLLPPLQIPDSASLHDGASVLICGPQYW